jgi:tetrapyrrole methylase family protein/MazG family protein
MPDRPRVVVVGLGPAGPELIDRATLDAIASIDHRFVRTRRHPAAADLDDAVSFDDVYDAAATLDDVYESIVERLVAAAIDHGEVLYAVPGSPLVAERTVELLRADGRVDVDVRPSMSFLDLVWNRLGVDPIAVGVRIVDGQRFATEAAGERGPLLVAQCDSRHVLSDIKLTIDQSTPPDRGTTITVLQRLGTAEEVVTEVPWFELDRVEPDHLTMLWVPRLAAPIGAELARFVELVGTLRRECPWDREQTHASLMRHLVEETYEVVEAIEHLDVDAGTGYDDLEEELGDLLFQIVFHATLAAEQGQFTLADVAQVVHDKLRHRHPHVFGGIGVEGTVEVDGADDVVQNWEQIKKAEKGRESVFDGIPSSLPSLLYALKVQKKANSLAQDGLDVPDVASISSAVDEVARAATPQSIGALLFAATEAARQAGVDPEVALRAEARGFRDRVRTLESGGS